jgi:sorbitol-6-phosphate 2-dehydrogenase
MGDIIRKKVNVIAPVLRMLLGKESKYPLVRFTGDKQINKSSIKISLPHELTGENVVQQLSATLKTRSQDISAVYVDGAGTFEILRPSQKSAGKVAGKVAVVTGAAQGFGLEIACDMAKQGACVVLGDINAAEVQNQVRRLRNQYGDDRAMAVRMDVTDSASIQAALDEVVRYCGGLDVFISNAGVLKAESVKTQPVQDFDLVTQVNYRGYFLCTQAVSKILALQHKANSCYTSDIIQINSKSGLAGSNRNAAYAGSKFGGLGLTQSFALELIEDGIKVNSVCPGNFFDGPLWSDPENGLFVQYLRAGKIPGAKTVADVRRAYEAKVPMRRGCTTADVMTAIYYLIEQQYETGQAFPVTGGQVMLR